MELRRGGGSGAGGSFNRAGLNGAAIGLVLRELGGGHGYSGGLRKLMRPSVIILAARSLNSSKVMNY